MDNKEKTIGLASSSARRKIALEQIPELKVIDAGGGDESQSDDVVTIALKKIAFAYPTILESCQSASVNLVGILAADTNTLIKVLEQPGFKLERKGKPKKSKDTHDHFRRMNKSADTYGAGYYEVISASALQTGTESVTSVETTHVLLNQAKLNHLSSDDGFAEYQDNFAQFYNSPAYRDSGCRAIEMTDVSAGISFPVLVKMGAVEKVNGVKLKELAPQTLEMILKQALLNVSVGFSPQVLEKVHPDALAYLMSWPWTNKVLDFILSK